MALVTVVISYAALFSDMGLSTAFVQRQHITLEERSSLYWLSVSVGLVLMLFVMVASPLIAGFFNEPKLIVLLLLVSTNFLVVALGQQLRVDAEKALIFRPVALIEITAAIGGLTVAVVAALMDWGVYALVAAAMCSAWIMMILCWLILAKGWRPLWRLRWREIRWFVRFGGGMVVNNVVNQINATVDLLLGGRLIGTGQLGIYSVPRNLVLQIQSMVNPVFTRVGFPVIASIQEDKMRVQQTYLMIMNFSASVNAPIYVSIAIFAPELVELMLGKEFQDGAPLLRVLAIWGLLRSFGNPVGSLLFGLGYIRLATQWNLGLLLVISPALWFGSQFGAIGMAWAMTALMALLFIPGWALLVRPACGLGLWTYSKEVLKPTFCALIAGFLGYLAVSAFDIALIRLIGGYIVGFGVYSVLTLTVNRKAVKAIRYMLPRR